MVLEHEDFIRAMEQRDLVHEEGWEMLRDFAHLLEVHGKLPHFIESGEPQLKHKAGRVYNHPNFQLNTRDLELRNAEGELINLTRREFLLFSAVVFGGGRIVTREELRLKVYGTEYVSIKGIYVHISKVRKKLLDRGVPNIIETVWGFGFRLKQLPEE